MDGLYWTARSLKLLTMTDDHGEPKEEELELWRANMSIQKTEDKDKDEEEDVPVQTRE